MHRGAESCSFSSRETNNRNSENIGTDLAPDRALATSTSQPDLGRLDAKGTKTIEAVCQSQSRAFHHCSCDVSRGHIRRCQTMKYSYALRKARGAFSSQIG